MSETAREARLRRQAKARGLAVVRSRYQATRGTYGLIDPFTNAWVAMDWRAGNGYGLDLDAIEEWLTAAA